MNHIFRDDLWIKQELSKVDESNAADMYLSHMKTFRLIGGTHRQELLDRIKAKFPRKFSGGSR